MSRDDHLNGQHWFFFRSRRLLLLAFESTCVSRLDMPSICQKKRHCQQKMKYGICKYVNFQVLPIIGILLQQRFDKLLGVVTDVVPVWRWEVKSAHANRLEYLLIRVAIEWRVATQENVSNDSNGPPIVGIRRSVREGVVRRELVVWKRNTISQRSYSTYISQLFVYSRFSTSGET